MMPDTRTFVDHDRYMFTTDVDHDGLPAYVAAHWVASPFTPEESFLAPLRSYLSARHEVSEVWLLFPIDLLPLFESLRRLTRFGRDNGGSSAPRYRFFGMNADGQFLEQGEASAYDSAPATGVVMAEVIQDGLRQIFRDTAALASAAAGYHFTHPSGAHSEHFMRASQAVSRASHSSFVAMALMRLLEPPTSSARIWVDTATIATVAHAYNDLLRRGGHPVQMTVESFGGYKGLVTALQPRADDLVLISSSTSGALACQVVERKRVPANKVTTLFYLSESPADAANGQVLCDLTNRDDAGHVSVRESRIKPYPTFKADECERCAKGSGEIRLEGDSFFPAALSLDLRMPGFADRPAPDGGRTSIVEFAGQDYFEHLFGTGAITYANAGTGGAPHGVTTRLGHLIAGAPNETTHLITAEVDSLMRRSDRLVGVVSLTDDDSIVLGQFLAGRLLPAGYVESPNDSGAPFREWRPSDTVALDNPARSGTILVCAAVVGSGRKLTAIARELRKLRGKFDTRYFIVAAHPESQTTWSTLQRSISRTSADQQSDMCTVWQLPREPRFPQARTPWAREGDTLTTVGTWLAAQSGLGTELAALETRMQKLGAVDDQSMFWGADGDIATVNTSFALWPFHWEKHASGATPNHAEIYATVAHLLYESRHRSPFMDSRSSTARRHGYALHPAIFDRYNDPVIQAAILRASEPGELHYWTDKDASRAVGDLLIFVLSNVGNEAGGAAYEFLLALCDGCRDDEAPGMRISDDALRAVLEHLESPTQLGPDFTQLPSEAAHVRALLLFLRERNAAGSRRPLPVAKLTSA